MNEYEVQPQTNRCPVHGEPLNLEAVPVVGGFVTPSPECALSKRFPYGRVAASSGTCVTEGSVRVYRCPKCVEMNPARKVFTREKL